MKDNIQPLNWKIGVSKDKNSFPTEYYPATVPGAAQLDIAAAYGYPPYSYSDNFKQFDWMENVYFVYSAEFGAPEHNGENEVWFHSEGIDYHFKIYLNNQILTEHEGMFSEIEINLTPFLKTQNTLSVWIDKVPKMHEESQDRTQAANVAKPAVSYGWDWHPRIVPSGIWEKTGIVVKGKKRFDSCSFRYELNEDCSVADFSIEVECLSCENDDILRYSLLYEDGAVASSDTHSFKDNVFKGSLTNPQLWWTYDYGVPYMYRLTVQLLDRNGIVIDERVECIGFRKVRLIMNEGAWNEPTGFPKTRSNAPIQLELNGKKIFAKGTNWVNPEIFPGTINEERYSDLIDLAVKSNFNIFRCWGGCGINKDSFYRICDERGILVWQEFPLACNCYPDDKHYLKILEQEATAIIKKLKTHPCLAIFCGGNELFNSWSRMTDQSLPLRLLNSLAYKHCPEIPYLNTSPLTGMAHGNYLFRWDGKEVFEWMQNSHFTAYCEFGIPGIAPLEVLKKIIPENEMYPPRPETSWEVHHAYKAWDCNIDTWLNESVIEHYWGKTKDIRDLVKKSSIIQTEGYKAIFEEARRQKPYCSMAINWCFNEPWPTAANNSLVSYPDIPKPALGGIADSCRPICASARFKKFQWEEGELFSCDLWLLNDTYQYGGDYTLDLYIYGEYSPKIHVLTWNTVGPEPYTNIEGPKGRIALPKWKGYTFTVQVEVKGMPELSSAYTLAYKPATKREKPKTSGLNISDNEI